MPSDAELLKAYLADRDVPCPGCGYSLKGCASTQCPECGSGIEITLRGNTTSAAHWIAGTIVISGAFGLALPTLLNSVAGMLFAPDYRLFPGPILCAPLTVGIAAMLWVWITRRIWLLHAPKVRAWTLTLLLGAISWALALTPFFVKG
jgi:hypothetical protein